MLLSVESEPDIFGCHYRIDLFVFDIFLVHLLNKRHIGSDRDFSAQIFVTLFGIEVKSEWRKKTVFKQALKMVRSGNFIKPSGGGISS